MCWRCGAATPARLAAAGRRGRRQRSKNRSSPTASGGTLCFWCSRQRCRVAACQPIPGHAAGGPMSTRDQLNSYIEQLERRLRLGALLRGAAILTSAALATTVVLVLITNPLRFPDGASPARAWRFCSALVLAIGVWPGASRCIALEPPARRRQGRELLSRNSSSAWSPSPSATSRTREPSSTCWRPTR